MAMAKQGSKQSRGKAVSTDNGEEGRSRLVSERVEGGTSSSPHLDLSSQLGQMIAVVSNMSAKLDLLLQSRSDGLGNRVGIGTSMIRVPANDVGIDDPRQRINRDQQQEEQFLSSSSRRHHDGLLQGRQQEVYPVSAGTGRPRDELLQGLHRQAQQEQTWSSGGRHQQGSVGRHQQIGGPVMTPRFGMEHVRPNAQEGFHQPVPNEDCSKLMDYCYKGILDNREGIGTPHARVFANVVDSHDQFQGIRHDFNVEEQTRSSVGRHQQGNMQSSSQLGIRVSYIGSSGGPGFGRNVSDGISPYPKAEYDATSTCGYANQPQKFGNNNANSMSTDASRSLSNSYGQSAPSSYKPSPSMMQIVPHSGQQQMEFAGSAALRQQQQQLQQQQQQQLTQFSQGRPFQSLEGLKSLAAEMSESILVAEGGDFDCGTPPSKKKGFKLDKLDFNFNGPGGFDLDMVCGNNKTDVDGGNSSGLHYHFIEKALPLLVSMLLETLLKQEEDQDQDDGVWNLSMAGGICLGLIAKTVGDAVVPLVMPFVQANIVKPDWRSCEAATFALGSVLEGPSIEKLQSLVQAGLDFLLNAMKDQNTHVKDTTAWTLSRIFEILHSPESGYSIINSENVPRILGVLLESIKDVPNVAEKVCGAIYFLAQGFEEVGSSSAFLLTPYLRDIIASLISTADQTDGNDDLDRGFSKEKKSDATRHGTSKFSKMNARKLVSVASSRDKCVEASSSHGSPSVSIISANCEIKKGNWKKAIASSGEVSHVGTKGRNDKITHQRFAAESATASRDNDPLVDSFDFQARYKAGNKHNGAPSFETNRLTSDRICPKVGVVIGAHSRSNDRRACGTRDGSSKSKHNIDLPCISLARDHGKEVHFDGNSQVGSVQNGHISPNNIVNELCSFELIGKINRDGDVGSTCVNDDQAKDKGKGADGRTTAVNVGVVKDRHSSGRSPIPKLDELFRTAELMRGSGSSDSCLEHKPASSSINIHCASRRGMSNGNHGMVEEEASRVDSRSQNTSHGPRKHHSQTVHPHNASSSSMADEDFQMDGQNRLWRRMKRQCTSFSNNYGESSAFSSVHSFSAGLLSAPGSSGSSSSLGPTVEIDESSFSNAERCDRSHDSDNRNDESEERARQIGADEELARQLQEELYNENSKADTSIALILQHEENSRAISKGRSSSMARLCTYFYSNAGLFFLNCNLYQPWGQGYFPWGGYWYEYIG